MSENYVLSMRGVTKRFGPVTALNHVNLEVRSGEIHALLGENGAGKSTLMKILNGIYSLTEGEIYIRDEKVKIDSRKSAMQHGLGFVFQELNLVPTLTVLENIYLGRLKTGRFGKVAWKEMRAEYCAFAEELGVDISPDNVISEMSIAQRQMVEIMKVLLQNADILVFDEPTATLTGKEIDKLFEILENLRKKGVTIIYISHRLEEIFQICDRITVLRDGQYICSMEVKETTRDQLIEKMVGRSMDSEFPPRCHKPGEVIMNVQNLFTPNFLKDISFDLRRGEILGVAGLVGSGRTETAKAVFGADKIESGAIYIDGKKVKILSVSDAKRNSIGLVPEDRKDEGLAVTFSVLQNITITDLKKVCAGGLLNRKKETEYTQKYIGDLKIKVNSVNQKAEELSGGNQQKIVAAKWLYADADILILDEPTRGIDVGAKYDMYVIMNELAAQGKSIIMISSELSEVMALSDRIMVMYEGSLRAVLDNHEGLKSEEIMSYAVG